MRRPQQRGFRYVASRPRWSAADHSTIDLDIEYEHIGKPSSTTASPFDTEAHGRQLFQRALAGEFGEIAPYEPPPQAPNIGWPAGARAAWEAYQASPEGQQRYKEMVAHNEEIASGSSRGIVAHAEMILSTRLGAILVKGGVSQADVDSLSFNNRISKSAALGLISIKERDALNKVREIRNEVAHGSDGHFYTEKVRVMCNDLCAIMAGYLTYLPTSSLEDKWIDLIFINAYTILDGSLQTKFVPNFFAAIVS